MTRPFTTLARLRVYIISYEYTHFKLYPLPEQRPRVQMNAQDPLLQTQKMKMTYGTVKNIALLVTLKKNSYVDPMTEVLALFSGVELRDMIYVVNPMRTWTCYNMLWNMKDIAKMMRSFLSFGMFSEKLVVKIRKSSCSLRVGANSFAGEGE